MDQFGKREVGKKEERNDNVKLVDKWRARHHRSIWLQCKNATDPRTRRIRYSEDHFYGCLIKSQAIDNNQKQQNHVIIGRTHSLYLRDDESTNKSPCCSI